MRKVYIARDSMEAHFVRGLLEAEGIEVSIQGEMLGAVRGSVPLTPETSPSLWVREEDVERAEPILELHRRGERPQHALPPWRCAGCGERVEGQFTHCWRCGTAFEEPEDPVPAEPVDRLVLDYDTSIVSEPEWAVEDGTAEPEDPDEGDEEEGPTR